MAEPHPIRIRDALGAPRVTAITFGAAAIIWAAIFVSAWCLIGALIGVLIAAIFIETTYRLTHAGRSFVHDLRNAPVPGEGKRQ